MRPTDPSDRRELYECYGCGNRIEGAERTFCPTCGSELRNIGRARDF